MERRFNTEEALKILKDCYITDSVQSLRKWIREGKIVAEGTPYRQEGYTIKEDDLKAFIEEERPGLLEILNVYHQVNDRIQTGIKSIVNPQEEQSPHNNKVPNPKTEEIKIIEPESESDDLGVLFEMLMELEQQIKELQLKIENVIREISERKEFDEMKNELDKMMEFKIDQMKKELEHIFLADMKIQPITNKSTPDKSAKPGNHRTKSLEEFIGFLRKEFWNANPGNEKLKGERNKKFKEEARGGYSLFYDEKGLFRDEELRSANDDDGLELKLMINNQESIITGQNRKELMKQYFEAVFLPKMKGMENPLGNI
ncbi:hypothetical protein [Neobacillus niacini]|uniref:hypothetical protein n=1 Tax=Neobacillus niacini TaxID=86668 RepID=UPI0021CB4D6C|nr:hypothetical protein [Neobacillus niacini]MCM3768384.1 hypothetical protein [Neobacillus niacini]